MEFWPLKAGNRNVPVSNLQKVLFPGGQFTKAEVLNYYSRVAPALLPHLRNRPVTLVRYPEGVFKHPGNRPQNRGSASIVNLTRG